MNRFEEVPAVTRFAALAAALLPGLLAWAGIEVLTSSDLTPVSKRLAAAETYIEALEVAQSNPASPPPQGRSVPSLVELAAQIHPGRWLLVPAPISEVLYKREELNSTTWGVTGSRSVVDAWSAWAWDSNCAYMHNGGHADYGGNEVYRFCFGTGWERIIETYMLPERTAQNPCPQPTAEEHGPPSSHTYDSLIWSAKTKSVFYFNNGGYCFRGNYKGPPMVWEIIERKWKRRADLDFAMRGFGRTALDADGNIVIAHAGGIRVLDPASGKYIRAGPGTNISGHGSMIYAPELERFFALEWSRLLSFGAATFAWRRDASHSLNTGLGYTSGMAWHGPSKQLVFWNGAREVVLYNPVTKTWKVLPNTAGPAPGGARPLSKWVYVGEHDLFVGLSSYRGGVWVYRLPPNDMADPTPNKFLQQ